MVGIEAQAAGLPCFFSDLVTDEILLSPNARKISLEAANTDWAKEILAEKRTETNRERGADLIRQAGYDIHEEARKLQNVYLEMADRACSGK